MILTLLGAPGSGKGTQGRRLAERLDLAYLSTGDLLRRAAARGTALGKQAKPFIDAGKLVPDDVLIPVVVAELTALTSHPAAAATSRTSVGRGVVLDGFPRTRDQAAALDGSGGTGVRGALLLQVPDDVVIARLASRLYCGSCSATFNAAIAPPKRQDLCDRCDGPLSRRADDSPETVRERLAIYARECQPLVQYYRQRGCLTELDGNGPADRVQEALLRAALHCLELGADAHPFAPLASPVPQPAAFQAA